MRDKGFSRLRVLIVVGVTTAVMAAVGVGVAIAVNGGTAGELNYQRSTFSLTGTQPGQTQSFQKKERCPANRHVTGGGFDGDNNANAQEGRPFDGSDAGTVPDDGWAVTATIFGTNSGKVTVWAICDD